MDTSRLQKFLVPAGLAGCVIILSYELFCTFMHSGSSAVSSMAGAVDRRQGTQSKPIQLSDLTRRNLFRPIISAPPPRKVVPIVVPVALPPPPPKIPISQKAAHLHLVGIVNGDPVQAIIEDARSHKTLYVTTGQTLDEVQVDKILSDRVVLSSADEHMDLML